MIKIDDEFTLTSDSYNWVLRYSKEGEINPKTGKPSIASWESYHGDLKFALLKYMNSATKPAKSVEELLNRLNEVENNIIILSIKNRK